MLWDIRNNSDISDSNIWSEGPMKDIFAAQGTSVTPEMSPKGPLRPGFAALGNHFTTQNVPHETSVAENIC